MADLTLRSVKGSPLTNDEVDDNFTNLNDDKAEKSANLSDLADAATARTNLGVAIGTDVQAYDADTAKYDDTTANFTGTLQNGGSNVVVDTDIGSTVQAYDAGLDSISGLTTAADKMIYTTASDTYAVTDLTSAGRAILDDADAAAQRTTLGVGTGDSPTFAGADLDGAVVINESGADVDFRVESDTDANAFFLEGSSGNVGIGTSSPEAKLTIESSTDASIDIIATNATTQDSFIKLVSPDTGTAYMGIDDSAGLLKINNTNGLSAPNHLVITSTGNVGIGTSSPGTELHVDGDIRCDGIYGEADTNTSIQFPGSDVITFNEGGSEAMRITSSGNVGIGTSSPSQKLEIIGSGSPTFIRLDNTSNAQEIGIIGRTFGAERWRISSANYNADLVFRNSDAGSRNAGFQFLGGDPVATLLTISDAGNVGIGLTNPSQKLHIFGDDARIQVTNETENQQVTTIGHSDGGGGGFIQLTDDSNTNDLILRSYGTCEIPFDLDVGGALSKGSGSFKIDHPLKPETHHLVHSFVEAPQADNIYRGKVDLVNGTATVNIDTVAGMTEGTFVALNGNVQCFTTNEDGWTAVRGRVEENILTIEAQDPLCTDTISWLVIGERQDQHMVEANWTDENGKVIVEPLKPTNEETESN